MGVKKAILSDLALIQLDCKRNRQIEANLCGVVSLVPQCFSWQYLRKFKNCHKIFTIVNIL